METEKLFHYLRGSITVLKSDIFFLNQKQDQDTHIDSAKQAISSITKSLQDYEIVDMCNKDTLRQNQTFVVLQDVIELLLREGKYRIYLEDNTIPYVLYADKKFLSLLVDELVLNAITFGSDAKISVNRYKDRFNLEVASSSKLLTPTQRNHIVDPFYTIDDDKKSGKAGVGLGLAMVNSICEYNGWNFEITTKGSNNIFRVCF